MVVVGLRLLVIGQVVGRATSLSAKSAVFPSLPGWNLGLLPLSVTVCSTILLTAIGLFAFRETLSTEKIIGVLLCIGGLVLITIKK